MKNDFPLKYMRDLLKDARQYIDLAYIDKDGTLKGRPDEGGLGEYIIFPSRREKLQPFAPVSFDISNFIEQTKPLSTKTTLFDITDTTLYISDDSIENAPVVLDIPKKEFKYPKFVEHVWNNLGKYNFKSISPEDMELLKSGNIAELDAYYTTDDDPIQIILSGKDFRLSKNLEGIYTAAVDMETIYQESCNCRHVVTRVRYDTCDVYMLCGVV